MNNSDLWVIMDLRGLVLQSYHSGNDPDSAERSIRSPNHTLDKFINRYLLPFSKLVPLNRMIAVNDAGNKYRQMLSEDYKANRKEPDPEIKMAMDASKNAVRELLHSLGIVQASVAGTEADDVIAYLSQKLPGKKLIYTVDADLVALANQDVTVFLKGEPHAVFKKGDITVQPRHVALFKSIVGDSSDNIPGVKGMGPSAWEKLVAEFGLDGLDELVSIAEADDVGRLRSIAVEVNSPVLNKLSEGALEWRKSYNLAKLRPELVDGVQGKEFTRIRWEKRLPDVERLRRLMTTVGAYWIEQDLGHLYPSQTLITASDWDDQVLAEAKQLFSESRYVSIDWESWNPHQEYFKQADEKYVDMFGQIISGMGLTCGENLEHTFYFQFDHSDEENNINKQHLIELLDCIPEGMPIVAQNALFERTVFMNEFGFDIPNLHDTKIMASHVDETMPSGLKDMTKQWLNYNQIRYESVIEKGKTMKDYTGLHVFKYGADDPLVTAHLYDLFYIVLSLEGTWEFVRDNEFPMTYVLSDAYLAGVSIDFEEVERQRAEDKDAFDYSIARIRELLETNLTEEDIELGAKNWAEELTANMQAECKFLIKELTTLHKAGNLIEGAKADKLLKKWLGDNLQDDSTLDELITALNEKSQREVFNNLSTARGIVKYKPYDETTSPAKFQWSNGYISKLSELYGMPSWPKLKDSKALEIFLDDLESRELTGEQRWFLNTVKEGLSLPENKRSQSSAGRALYAVYADNFKGSVTKSGTELNIDSPKQMSHLLYGTLGLPIRIRALDPSEGREKLGLPGAPQTNEDAVNMAIAVGDATGWRREVLECLVSAKKANTRIKFFYSKFPLWKHPIDGLIHPSFNSTGTETRRPTGSNPNMLQLSKKGDGTKVRRCFLPNAKLGHDLIVSIDWAAQELRVIAGLSGDKALTACYVGDNLLDVHSITAAAMSGTAYEEFIKIRKDKDHPLAKKFDDVRKKAKNVNFGSSYGIGAAKLARQLLCPVDEAQTYLAAKKSVYFGVEDWKEVVKNELHAKGYVSTQYGSRKHLFNKLRVSDKDLVAYYERATVNYLIQGCCADYLKLVLTEMHKRQTFARHGAVLVAPIYDEVVASCHSSQAVSLITEMYEVMTQGVKGINIPMLAAPSLGVNFADQIEILDDENDTLSPAKILTAIDKAFGIEVKEAA